MSCSVFVGNLTWSTTSEQLQEFAAPVGRVVSAEVKRHEDTARSKGWGLVTFSDHASAAKAVADLNATDLNGRAVHVRLDRDVVETSHNVFVGNLPWAFTSEELNALFQAYRPTECQVLTNMYGKSRGFAIVKFANEGDADRAIAGLNGLEVQGRNIECRLDRGPGKGEEVSARTSVFVAKIGPMMTDEALGQLFAHVGQVVSAKVNRYADKKAEGWGIVKFADAAAAKAAVETMNNVPSSPGQPGIKVRFDRK
mmetsp:Transcript_15419/g.27167  ORF Transcript_15419/g.27167 Transcript_15419/m.27167 type:complete len:254 (-) Transcript_15419:359-1120(-)|eukprot:CAMPEP_0184979098 /NCGR_PEP_ID=MMETSP1098-20130426/9457_1 /TAXON_ID=89044 /ORGANISM="Spumella elongata, Strain CCAP 955/1" /LENGTH=253 /DNA_ID=CAMNT_0027502365 /DNA_START=73 /DNA_END=834 /DNA_ORIENTATION=-